MLFNSYEFILLFLPITLAGFFLLARWNRETAIVWLVLASLFFYGWWNPAYLLLIVASMIGNFALGRLLSRSGSDSDVLSRRALLTIGIALNLALLLYYKYSGFLVSNINSLIDAQIQFSDVLLPLAISFFTFQQIAYLVDAYQRKTTEYRFSHYALFVTFFPQLIAGPIVHHKEMLPQFMSRKRFALRAENISVGGTIFAIGLFKKAILADGIAPFATNAFALAESGGELALLQAWAGALAYTLQLYFDFSGYSDMAIGAARMFGIRLPLNFHSPYKSTSIVEFWRRWHMTLSRFLRDYLYIPLGGSRKGTVRRYTNLLTTMLLGGLWHGAGWTFIIWGLLHGLYLVVNHAWSHLTRELTAPSAGFRRLASFASWAMTFSVVVIGWVFFRATDIDSALRMLSGMVGLNGVSLPNALFSRLEPLHGVLQSLGVTSSLGHGHEFVMGYLWIGSLLLVALLMPNTQQIMRRFRPAFAAYRSHDGVSASARTVPYARVFWRPTVFWAIFSAVAAAFGLLALTSVSEFLYFQF